MSDESRGQNGNRRLLQTLAMALRRGKAPHNVFRPLSAFRLTQTVENIGRFSLFLQKAVSEPLPGFTEC